MRVSVRESRNDVLVPIPGVVRLIGFTEWIDLKFVWQDQTPREVIEQGIRNHLTELLLLRYDSNRTIDSHKIHPQKYYSSDSAFPVDDAGDLIGGSEEKTSATAFNNTVYSFSRTCVHGID